MWVNRVRGIVARGTMLVAGEIIGDRSDAKRV